MADDFFSLRPSVKPTIYAYSIPGNHPGYLKVGFTDRDVETRIYEQLHTSGLPHRTELTFSAMRPDGSCFTDHDVHAYLKRRGYRQLNAGEDRNEWFYCTVNDVRAACIAVRDGTANVENRSADFGMRPEQYHAVQDTIRFFRSAKDDDPSGAPKFLWNAKMRFGKTFAAYQLAKKMGFKRVLVLTFKPAVESAWREDLVTHVDFEGWQFVSNKDAQNNEVSIDMQFHMADKSRPIVVFGSFQDLLGTNDAGGIKAKNQFIHDINWDLVIFDEYHFGAWRENAKKLFETPDDEQNADFNVEKYKEEEADNAINESWLPITTSYYLYLSGTPFRAINSGEFIEEQIFNWTYSDEQKAKAEWVGSGNPYAALPRMIMMTYRIPDSIRRVAQEGEFDEFDLNLFFSADFPKGHVEEAKFKYENEVQKWLDLMRGSYLPSSKDEMKVGEKPPMPYSDARLLSVLQHTLWFLPNVASCYAMANLLAERQNTFYHDYKVIVCAGKLTPKEKKELTEQEKELKSKRKKIQEKLIKFATRVPVFMYLSEYREKCLKDVITLLEPKLFKLTTGLDVKDFDLLCSLNVFNGETMNQAIWQFKRYEDASLGYTGINRHDAEENVGGWDTVIRKEEFEAMFTAQQKSMAAPKPTPQVFVNQPVTTVPTQKPQTSPAKPSTSAGTPIRPAPQPVVPRQPIQHIPIRPTINTPATQQKVHVDVSGVGPGTPVIHKSPTLGEGVVVKIDQAKKYIHIKFAGGVKMFTFPDCFDNGFVKLK